MNYHNDPCFSLRAYFPESSAAECFASSGYDGIPPPADVSFDSIPAELPNDEYFYDTVGNGMVNYEEYSQSDEVSPMANAIVADKKKGNKNKKRKRDPNKPKGWISAILMYSNAHRARVQTENPDATFGEIARLLSAEYRALDPEDRAVWEKAHVADRTRYEHEMLSYVPPSQITPNDDDSTEYGVEETVIRRPMAEELEAEALVAGRPQAKKLKKKKDPNAPKRNLSAWHFFSGGDARKQVIAKLPGATLKDIMGILSQKYKILSKEERAPLELMAAADKERYQRQMAEYKGSIYQYIE